MYLVYIKIYYLYQSKRNREEMLLKVISEGLQVKFDFFLVGIGI